MPLPRRRKLPRRIAFDDGFLLTDTSLEGFVRLLAEQSGLSVDEARAALEEAQREGWIRIASADRSVSVELAIPKKIGGAK